MYKQLRGEGRQGGIGVKILSLGWDKLKFSLVEGYVILDRLRSD